MPKKITVWHAVRETNGPAGMQVFIGKNCDVLAANYQSRHPELKEVKFEVVR